MTVNNRWPVSKYELEKIGPITHYMYSPPDIHKTYHIIYVVYLLRLYMPQTFSSETYIITCM